ncbi:Laccase [Trametes cinnabarina]|uniref:laccase n=1 Tax=Pycnoporus cinnabarinus TaxID=5643 RepID=A0A060S652_PYCCI|nr:Laccase [Trametes cinnabarina]
MSSSSLWRTVVLFSLGAGAMAAIGPVTDLVLVNKVVSPDGVPRSAVLAGGTHPGPLIKGKKGDKFRINVVNMLQNETMLTATSIHWHGLFQHESNWADGTAFVTQCPITNDDSFLYNFRVPDQAGTFWYHSHLSTQYCDGLRGPLVVYDQHDPHAHLYDVDDESTVITLTDWYHIAAAHQPLVATADSILINGLGRWAGNPTSKLSVIEVQHGKRYRFRLLNMACDPNFMFSIDGHPMTIIEADGQNTQPHTVDKLQIFASQRYSFVLNANQTVGNYWIRASPDRIINDATGFENGINSAILRYKGAPHEEPSSKQSVAGVRLLNEANLRPLEEAKAWVSLNGTQFLVNGVPFVSPSVPVLLQILSGSKSAQQLLPHGSVYTLPPKSTVELSMPAGVVGGPHPFHLHGHVFSVVQSAGMTEPNYVNPVKRDTVSIGNAGDNVTIRFETDNSGPWFLHCHIDWHLQLGLAIVFAEDTPDTQAVDPVPESWKELCPKYEKSLQHH